MSPIVNSVPSGSVPNSPKMGSAPSLSIRTIGTLTAGVKLAKAGDSAPESDTAPFTVIVAGGPCVGSCMKGVNFDAAPDSVSPGVVRAPRVPVSPSVRMLFVSVIAPTMLPGPDAT
jgi:hypothetical protein